MNSRDPSRGDTEAHAMRLAVLIDADNAQAAVIDGLLAEIARYGEATVKRIYGDFTSPHSNQWKKVLNQYAIKPIQQFAYTTGKNATDSMLIIDAMDLLYTRRFDGFCLVSSDSDFTGLALRIREEGLRVLGFGEKKTPDAFRNACHRFVFTELLRLPPQPPSERPTGGRAGVQGETARQAGAATEPAAELARSESANQDPAAEPPAEFPLQYFLRALEQASDDEGWAHLSSFGNYLTQLQPEFDPRLYGFKKLSDLVRHHQDIFEVEDRAPAGAAGKILYVRRR